jgi:hypothetical protein
MWPCETYGGPEMKAFLGALIMSIVSAIVTVFPVSELGEMAIAASCLLK